MNGTLWWEDWSCLGCRWNTFLHMFSGGGGWMWWMRGGGLYYIRNSGAEVKSQPTAKRGRGEISKQ